MRPYLPPLHALLAFESAARHLSFTKAAHELNLTQAAISHQIKQLEDRLGNPLFLRGRGRLTLSTVGIEYLESIDGILAQLLTATDQARKGGSENKLTISCLPTFATECLIPLLPDFSRRYPELQIHLSTSSSFEAFQITGYDIAIRYGTGRWDGVRSDWLCDERYFPVVSPALFSTLPDQDVKTALEQLIRLRTYFTASYEDDWPAWLKAAGLEDIAPVSEYGLHMQLTSLAGIREGLGIGIGRTPLVNRDLAHQKLLAPFGPYLLSKSAYYIASPLNRYHFSKVIAFREWLQEHAPLHFATPSSLD